MRIAIIGGLGLIGRAFSKYAIQAGHQIVALTRNIGKFTDTNNLHIRSWDGKNSSELKMIIDGCDALINLAGSSIGQSRWTNQRKKEMVSSRLEPANAVIEALPACNHPPKVLLQASAIGYYGSSSLVKDESSAAGSDYLAQFAIQWENATIPVDSFGVRRVVMRSGIVLDRNVGVLPKLCLPFKLFVGGKIGSGNQIYSWIHIEDEALAMLFLLENSSCNGIYNLTAPTPRTNLDFSQILANEMKRPAWMTVPGFALKLLMGEMSTLVLDGQNILPKRLIEAGFIYTHPTLEDAIHEILR